MEKSQSIINMEESIRRKKERRHRVQILLAQLNLEIEEYEKKVRFLKEYEYKQRELERREQAVERDYYDELER